MGDSTNLLPEVVQGGIWEREQLLVERIILKCRYMDVLTHLELEPAVVRDSARQRCQEWLRTF